MKRSMKMARSLPRPIGVRQMFSVAPVSEVKSSALLSSSTTRPGGQNRGVTSTRVTYAPPRENYRQT